MIMLTYRLGELNELFRADTGKASVYETAILRSSSLNINMFNILESHLFVYEGTDLILTVPFGAFWDRWFDKRWLSGQNRVEGTFELFCGVMERYIRRVIRCRLKEQV